MLITRKSLWNYIIISETFLITLSAKKLICRDFSSLSCLNIISIETILLRLNVLSYFELLLEDLLELELFDLLEPAFEVTMLLVVSDSVAPFLAFPLKLLFLFLAILTFPF